MVNVYYFLYSLQLMLYTHVGKGQEVYPHTQSAVNNFLGLHNYDAIFQILVGSWCADKEEFANGNILVWEALLNVSKDTQVERARDRAREGGGVG